MRVPNCPRRGKRVGNNSDAGPWNGEKGSEKKSDAALVFDEPLSKNNEKRPEKTSDAGPWQAQNMLTKGPETNSDASALLVPSDWNPKASAAGNAGTVPYDPKSN